MWHLTNQSPSQTQFAGGSTLHIRMLGTNAVKFGNASQINFGSRKEQALFFYLVLNQNPSSRDTLAALLWPDKPEEAAKNNLRTTLASLKRSIERYLTPTPTTVAFNHNLVYESDVRTLQTRLNSATLSRDPIGLYQAQKLYRGEFLQGFHVRRAVPFEAWVSEQRERLHLLVLRALELGAELCIEKNDVELGLEIGRRHLALEPWSEEAHRQVMQMLAASGQRAKAIQQYEICRELLADEFSLRPSKETTDLYEQIYAGTYSSPEYPKAVSVSTTVEAPLATENKGQISQPTLPNNLPAPLSIFIGRQSEVKQIAKSLNRKPCRLMTIVGLGGMGKSTLAIQTGRHLLASRPKAFLDGIFFVPLSGISASEEGGAASQAILRQIAEQIGCTVVAGAPLKKQLEAFLSKRHLLLILDNFEHLINETATLVTLLERAPNIKMLTTSRTRLNVRGESVLQLSKLSLPSHPPSIATTSVPVGQPSDLVPKPKDSLWEESDAVAMFVQRAQLHSPGFELKKENRDDVYQICHFIDGLPLGIELASSMLPLLALPQLAKGLSKTLDFLETDISDIPREQRTLRTVFERSWQLLDAPEQNGLAALSIFPNTFLLDAAEQIAQISKSALRRLLNQSLVEKARDERFGLHRSIREYAMEKLQSQEELLKSTRLAFSEYYLNFLAKHEQGQVEAEQEGSTAKLQAELVNIRWAWRHAVDEQLFEPLNVSMHTLFLYYEQQGLYITGVDDARYALEQSYHNDRWTNLYSTAQLDVIRGRFLTYLGWMNTRLGHLPQAEEAIQSAYDLLQDKGIPEAMVLCLSIWININRGDNPQKSKSLCSEAKQLLTAIEGSSGKALIYQRAADISYLLGDYEDAAEECTQAIALAEEDSWKWGAAISHETMGSIYRSLGRYSDAKKHFLAALAIAEEHNLPAVQVSTTLHLGGIARLQGKPDDAIALYDGYKKMSTQMQLEYHCSAILWEEGCMAEQCGDYGQAKTLLTQSLEKPRHPGQWGHVLPTLGWALIGLGELDNAHNYFSSVLAEAQSKHLMPINLDAQAGLLQIERLQPGQESTKLSDGQDDSNRAKLKQIFDHPATAEQTRDRINKIM